MVSCTILSFSVVSSTNCRALFCAQICGERCPDKSASWPTTTGEAIRLALNGMRLRSNTRFSTVVSERRAERPSTSVDRMCCGL